MLGAVEHRDAGAGTDPPRRPSMRTSRELVFGSGVAVLLLAAAFASPGLAQGTARSMDIDLSIRSAGMGGAANAVFWGHGTDHWANPALLCLTRGLRYEWGRTRLVPALARDIVLTSHVVKGGGGGVGLLASGLPSGLGRVRLDYGASTGTDPSGNPIGTFSSYEDVDSWGVGVGLVRLTEGLMGLTGREAPRWSRFVEVAGGLAFKDVEVALAPGFTGGVARTRARDRGVLVRLTPVDLEALGGPFPLRLDVGYGASQLSYNDDAVMRFLNEDRADRVSRHRRDGFAVRLAADPPALRALMEERSTRGGFARGLSPLVSLGMASDTDDIDAGDGTRGYRTESTGFELALANVLAFRWGRYRDRLGDIDGSTSGWSVGLPVGEWGGARFEHATFPQAEDSGLDDLDRDAFMVWMDPLAVWRSVRARP
jgi:hypothetical protein